MTVMGFGAFGKMPAVGDFFRLNAPSGFVRAWDDWLQGTMIAVSEALGAGWDAHYMSAPIWRFSLAAGLAGPQPVMGVLMPSVDRVGRRFPLTLMTPLPVTGADELAHFSRETLFGAAETLALEALEDDMTTDRLTTRLAELPAPGSVAETLRDTGDGTLHLVADEDTGVLPTLATRLLSSRYARPSLWTAHVDGREHLMICEGLPSPRHARGFFDLSDPAVPSGAQA